MALAAEIDGYYPEGGGCDRPPIRLALIAATPSTKNRAKPRDPQMQQTKKGKQWYFGMKAHIGADAHTGLVQVSRAPPRTRPMPGRCALLHGQEAEVFADAGYQGADKRADTSP